MLTSRLGLGRIEAVPDYDDGRLAIRPQRLVVLVNGELLQLTGRELAVLVELRRHAGCSRTREQLVEAVWGPGEPVTLRTVDGIIVRLRVKLGTAVEDVSYIHTSIGVGYKFDPSPKAESMGDSAARS